MPTLVQRPSTGSATLATIRRRRSTPWWHIAVALVAAFLLLAASIILLAWALPHWPRPPLRKGAAPLLFTIQSAEATPDPSMHKTEVVPPEQQQPQYIRTVPSQEAATPPPDPKFISARDTQDAAEKAAEDPFKPLPTQDGKEIATYDFLTNPYIPGKITDDTASEAAAAAAPAPTPPPPQPDAKDSPTPPPADTPPPKPDDFLTLRASSTPSNTPPAPSPTPRPKASSTPPIEDALAQQAAKVAQENRSLHSTGLQQPSGQPQTVQSKMSGAVSNRGKPAPRAISTPLGKYEKAMEDAVAERWYQLVNDRMSDLIKTENVKIHFYVTRAGKAISVRTNGPNQNTVLSTISVQAIMETDLPPIPDEVASLLPEGQLEVDYTFGLFEN